MSDDWTLHFQLSAGLESVWMHGYKKQKTKGEDIFYKKKLTHLKALRAHG